MPTIFRSHLYACCIAIAALFSSSLSSAAAIGHAPWVGDSFQGIPCEGQIENFGPYDYLQRAKFPSKLGVVERYHFTSNVEQLVSGETNTSPLPDLDYTLRAWPNHHRALYSVVRYRIRELNSTKTPSRRNTPAECYLQRANNFSPKDGTVLMLYGMLSHRTGRKDQAVVQYREAVSLEPTNLQAKYNLGLLLSELGEFSEAQQYAKEVYSRGFPLPGLKKKLEKAGYWDEAPKESTSSGVSEVQQ